jgi:hypothetical protein
MGRKCICWTRGQFRLKRMRVRLKAHVAENDSGIRRGLVALASLVGAFNIWLLTAELFRAHIPAPVTEITEAADAALQRESAVWSARVGFIRGELWADAARTFSEELWQPHSEMAGTRRRDFAQRSVYYAPHFSEAWVLSVPTDAQGGELCEKAIAAIRMSYFTAFSHLDLAPLRLIAALRSGAFEDPELQEMVKREARLMITRRPDFRSALTTAYAYAPPAGRTFLEAIIREVEPGLLPTVVVPK